MPGMSVIYTVSPHYNLLLIKNQSWIVIVSNQKKISINIYIVNQFHKIYKQLYTACNLWIIKKLVHQEQSCPASILSSLQFHFPFTSSPVIKVQVYQKKRTSWLSEAKTFVYQSVWLKLTKKIRVIYSNVTLSTL